MFRPGKEMTLLTECKANLEIYTIHQARQMLCTVTADMFTDSYFTE